jgi:hypothetical protein
MFFFIYLSNAVSHCVLTCVDMFVYVMERDQF